MERVTRERRVVKRLLRVRSGVRVGGEEGEEEEKGEEGKEGRDSCSRIVHSVRRAHRAG